MANDTPRYGSRGDEENRRYTEDSKLSDSRNARPSYMDPPENSNAAADRYGETRNPAATDSTSSLGGLRPSRYDDDDAAPATTNRYASPEPRDNGSYQRTSSLDTDRYKPSPAPSPYGSQDDKSRNPLLKSESSMRRFSWEDAESPKPAARPTPAARDYDPPRYEPRSPRLDEVSSAVPEPKPYAADRADASRYDAPRQAPAYQPPVRQQPYQDDPYAGGGYYETQPREAYDAYTEDTYRGVHARELADVDQDYAREYQYNAEGAELNHGYGDYDYDYQQFDQPYGEYPSQPRRGRAPLIILGALLGMVVLGVAGWVIFSSFSPGDDADNIPVVKPSDTRVKVPETAEVQPVKPATPQKTKLIYDRIRAEDEEPENTLVPREEQPADPNNQSNNLTAPSNDQTSVTPASDTQVTNGAEPLPLPLPPPPVDSADNNGNTQPTFNTTSENLNRGGEEVVVSRNNSNDPPAPASSEDLRTTSTDQTATDTQTDSPSTLTKLIQSPPLPREKPVPPSRQAAPGPAVPTGPIQIAPLPGSVERDATPTDQATNDQTAPAQPVQLQTTTQPRQQVTEETTTRPRSSRFDDDVTSTAPAQTNTEVAVVQPETQPVVAPQPTAPISGGRYVVQLASVNSEADARAAFDKAKAKHPEILGPYSLIIQQADLGKRGTFYRVFAGPLEKRSDASRLCDSLIAAGERDCVVRDR